jgi:hypothetical protein
MSAPEISNPFPVFTKQELKENPILRCFNPNMPPEMLSTAILFASAAKEVLKLPANAERTTALRKLREAKDCALTAIVIQKQLDREAVEEAAQTQ